MFFWSIAIAVTAIACAALLYAGRTRAVNATAAGPVDAHSHFRQLLNEIDQDRATGKLGEAEAEAAKAELAREMVRQRQEDAGPKRDLGRVPTLAGVALTALLAVSLYAFLGRPDLPGQPLAARPEAAARTMTLDDAVKRIEQALQENPADLRGWTVIAPAYLSQGRYSDAVAAYRHVLELGGASPAVETRLAEALLFEANGEGSDEALALLEKAAAGDASDPQPRLYLAAEMTRLGRFEEAARYWQEAIDLAQGDEPWLAAARQGLSVAQNDGEDIGETDQQAMIGQMVAGLAARLEQQGGSIEEWTQLVRAYLVLGDKDKAQAAYDDAVRAYPAAFDRGDLDSLALGGGLTLNGDKP
ncbi:c-type cytochrome biogenesis protein CcmI [Devosia sp. PTR5]|uniref:C-type cytochrome biogenesis protein CcmI n=1 Tax=Devosia oryzisoli TaxID=2774138 RepID=A0A927FV22_9HYPH|nr:c-type cytochrome biogenesis protein CcmI [Devosia oryzisoli]MBD8065318.1 c-type cytochrome biogenesis protein CcmI [Devosia oryzisoli]